MQPSRRFFLTGGRLFGSPWTQFVQRLGRSVKGQVEDISESGGPGQQARLVPTRREDVMHARALCAENRVKLALAGSHVARDEPVLWVDPAQLTGVEELSAGQVRLAPGTPAGELRERGLAPVDPAHDDTALAIWLAGLRDHEVDGLLNATGGLVSADVLLFDGQLDNLGLFGGQTQRPPLGLALRDIVSELFRLSQRPSMQVWREQTAWPARYRLDVLWREEPNLAHLLVGAGGTLAWLDTSTWQPMESEAAMPERRSRAPQGAAEVDFSAWVEVEVKRAFDPEWVLAPLALRAS